MAAQRAAMPEGTPFRFEGPVGPELLIDRQDELTTLARRAADRVGVRLAAPRRYGKTSLLLAHAAQLQETGWRTAHVDLGRVTDLTDVARRLRAAPAGPPARRGPAAPRAPPGRAPPR